MITFRKLMTLSEASLKFNNDVHDDYIESSFEQDTSYEKKCLHMVMIRGKDDNWEAQCYTEPDDVDNQDELYYKSHKNYKDMVNKFGKWLKKYTKGKWDLRKLPDEQGLEDMLKEWSEKKKKNV